MDKFGINNISPQGITLRANQAAEAPLGQGRKSDSQDKKIEKAASGFEALLLQQMFDAMWSTVPKDGALTGSHEESLYRGIFNEALANSVSSGQGVGIKDIIAKEMRAKEPK